MFYDVFGGIYLHVLFKLGITAECEGLIGQFWIVK